MNIADLDGVIRRVDSKDQPKPPDQVVVAYDDRTGVVVSGGWFSKGTSRFLVTTDTAVDFDGDAVEHFSDGEAGGQLRLSVRCRLKCPRGKEDRLVEAVGNADSPSAGLNRLIAAAAGQFDPPAATDPRVDAAVRLYLARVKWARFIADEVGRKTGLEMTVRLDPSPEALAEVELKHDLRTVSVKDNDDDLKAMVVAVLSVDEEARAVAFHHKVAEYRRTFRDRVKQWFHAEVTLHEFCFGLPDVRDKLRALVKGHAARYGRAVSQLRVELKPGFVPPVFQQGKHAHQCQVGNGGPEVNVVHTYQLELLNIAVFRRKFPPGAPDVTAWLHAALERHTKRIFFSRDYVDVVTEFHAVLHDAIRSAVAADAANVGLEVVQFTTVPALKVLDVLSGFKIDPEEVKFKTKNAGVDVTLDLVVKGRIEEYDKIRKAIRADHNYDPSAHILSIACEAVTEVMHDYSPGDFYLNFATAADGDSVEKELKAAIKDALWDELSASCSQVTVKVRDTALTAHFKAIRARRPRFDCTVVPGDCPDQPVTFDVTYHITKVSDEYWDKFMEGLEDATKSGTDQFMAGLTTSIQEGMKMALNRAGVRALQYRDPRERMELALRVFGTSDGTRPGLLQTVARRYGLIVEVERFLRRDTLLEDKLRVEQAATINAATALAEAKRTDAARTLEALRGQRLDMIQTSAPEDPGLKLLDDQIQKLEAGLTGPMAAAFRATGQLPPPFDAPPAGDDFARHLDAIGPAPPPQLGPKGGAAADDRPS